MTRFFKNFLLFLISVILMLLLAEGMVRLFYSQEINGSTKVLSDYGYALNRSYGSATMQFGAYRKLTYHFYPPALRDTKVNSSATPILALGDSVAFGWLLPKEHTFIYHLQQNLDQQLGKNKYQILNAASGGWGAAEFLAYLKQFGVLTHPKYVIVFLDSDDIGRALALDIYRLKNENSLVLVDHYHPFPHAKIKRFLDSGIYNFLLEHSQLVQLARNVFLHRRSNVHLDQLYIDQHVQKTRPIFQRSVTSQKKLQYAVKLGNAIFYNINLWCKEHNAKLIVVTTGYNAFYNPSVNDPTKAFIAQAPTFFKSQGIAYYDIAPEFKKTVSGKVFQVAGDSHPNAYGASVIAQLVWPWLKEKL